MSKKKKRYVNDGLDLDLTYILPNIIAMGFPAERIHGMYRNSMVDVQNFFNKKYPGFYKIYNLCSEKQYKEDSFQQCSQIYTFDDHNAPPFDMMLAFCEDVAEFVKRNPKCVAAIHCKAGKGRTGLMICCYLIYS